MTLELTSLAILALWGFALVMIEIAGKTRSAGPAWNVGNRDGEREFAPWIQRAGRALDNHKENFPLFLTAVLVCHLTRHHDNVTIGAAIGFVTLRVLHGVTYITGVTGLRTLAYVASLFCVMAMFSRLLF